MTSDEAPFTGVRSSIFHTLKSRAPVCREQAQTTLTENQSVNSRNRGVSSGHQPSRLGTVHLLLPGSTKKPCSIRLGNPAVRNSIPESNGDNTSHSMLHTNYTTRSNLFADRGQFHQTIAASRLSDSEGGLY